MTDNRRGSQLAIALTLHLIEHFNLRDHISDHDAMISGVFERPLTDPLLGMVALIGTELWVNPVGKLRPMSDGLDLAGCIALVIGASGGIGSVICRRLARDAMDQFPTESSTLTT